MAYNAVPTVTTGDLWTASNHNTYIRDNFAAGVPDIFTTKGDLAIASGANAAGRLGVGSNGKVLVASSAESLGIKWTNGFSTGKASRSTTQALSAGAQTKVQFTTEDFDSENYFTLGSSNTRCTIAVKGIYLFVGNVVFAVRAGSKSIFLSKNNALVSEQTEIQVENMVSGNVAGVFSLAASDYIELQVKSGSGSDVTFASLSVVKIMET